MGLHPLSLLFYNQQQSSAREHPHSFLGSRCRPAAAAPVLEAAAEEGVVVTARLAHDEILEVGPAPVVRPAVLAVRVCSGGVRVWQSMSEEFERECVCV
jgi:hypothetical protein